MITDCTQAATLIDGLEAAYLLADRGYDINALIALTKGKGIEPIIPSKRNRTEQRGHDNFIKQGIRWKMPFCI